MKYRVIIHQQEPLDLTVVGENGGISNFFYEEGHGTSEYYHAKLDGSIKSETIWDQLAEADHIQYKDWEDHPTLEQVISDALDWIAPMVEADQCERDDNIWSNIFK